MTIGIITIACGPKRYIDMANMLALSLSRVSPDIKRAVVSDAAESNFKGLFDIYIPANNSFGNGISQKLHLDLYSPFDETLFIDADCLACKSLTPMLQLCQQYPFVVFGDQIKTGEWYMDVAKMCSQFNVPSLPLFNGGTYYFKKGSIATSIFEKARELQKNYVALGFVPFRGSVNEEPLISVAMAINNIEAVDDKGEGMRTPIGLRGSLKIDVLNDKCYFDKQEELVSPAIMHFPGDYTLAFHYKREVAKLKTWRALPFLSTSIVSASINVTRNTAYATFVFLKRLAKIAIRHEKFDFSVLLPAFSNQ